VRRALGRAYEAGITGLAGMVAFNLLLSLFPLALLALFVWGRLLGSPSLEASAVHDLTRLFPSASESSLRETLAQLRDSSLTLGIAGTIGALWTSMSFWGALDSSFCRIYRLPCRSWLAQKRFALLMVFATLALGAVTVAVPTLQSLVVGGTDDLPLGLAGVPRLAYAISLLAGHLVLLVLFALVYWLVPHGRVTRSAIWPGAVVATALASAVGVAFPVYLARVSSLAHLGSSIAFGFVALLWFYAQALSLLAGAVVNAGRLARSPGGGESALLTIAAGALPGRESSSGCRRC
jgi:membrane protein